ncbi:MDR family oxidoreductase [Thiomonas sp.]|jgi:acrylyl-CoA reductase (NADPH)|uniref:acrylyl-CoA reductase (NADPH) n=1 Tax=Thiomonas sp. TaxID=2047785 RepID=UPI0026221E42|nr:MDR family oxidoreductase [Thiomonas sp.]
MFTAWRLDQTDQGFRAELTSLPDDALPSGDVTVAVEYSSLNYKDALALTNRGPVVRRWPMVPGIDGAGTVLHSTHPDWRAGDKWLLNGWGVGETHWGCLSQRARLNGDWLIPLPAAFTARQAMALGTAGYTAALCVLALQRHGASPGQGEVLVTGASGGVGSVAIALLAKHGWRVVASTGKLQEEAYLRQLGAAEVIDRHSLSAPGKPLQKERWAAVVDTVGSHTLVNACAQTRWGGVVAACGLAGGMDFPATVAPFILRGVTLVGIDSVMQPKAARCKAWQKLAEDIDAGLLDRIAQDVPLEQAVAAAQDLLDGKVRGRLVVRI